MSQGGQSGMTREGDPGNGRGLNEGEEREGE